MNPSTIKATANALLQILGSIAHKLTPAAKYIFGLYVRQAITFGIEDVVGVVICAVFLYVYYRYTSSIIGGKRGFQDYDIAMTVIGGFGAVASIGFGIALTMNAINYLTNPQFRAIQMLLGH